MSFSKQTVRDVVAQIKGQTVLVRADYNVSLKDGQVMDDLRIRANLPTLEFLRQAGAAKIVVISHLGRPKGQRQAELSLAPVAEELKKLLPATYTVRFVDEVYGEKVSAAVRDLPEGGILLLENLRFWPEEEQNDLEFARKIVGATGAKWFVQDGFAVIHRAHASTSAVTELLPAVAGLLVEQEVGTLEKVLDGPERPLAVVIGGAKVEDKQPLIDKFADLADVVVVGGKISADGYQSDNPKVKVADEDFDEDSEGRKLDLGPLATHGVLEAVQPARTVLWNGVLGYTEDPAFATSSTALAEYLGENPAVTSIICGGDTTTFVNRLMREHPNLDLHFSLVSTGGGAALELLLGEQLPGLEALRDK